MRESELHHTRLCCTFERWPEPRVIPGMVILADGASSESPVSYGLMHVFEDEEHIVSVYVGEPLDNETGLRHATAFVKHACEEFDGSAALVRTFGNLGPVRTN